MHFVSLRIEGPIHEEKADVSFNKKQNDGT